MRRSFGGFTRINRRRVETQEKNDRHPWSYATALKNKLEKTGARAYVRDYGRAEDCLFFYVFPHRSLAIWLKLHPRSSGATIYCETQFIVSKAANNRIWLRIKRALAISSERTGARLAVH